MRFLRQLQELRSRYTKARSEDVRQLILVSGGLADSQSPRVHLIPYFRIEGGLPEPPSYALSDVDAVQECDTEDAIA